MSDETDPEDLLSDAKNQRRHRTEGADTDDAPALEDAIADAYADLDSGEIPSNLALRDANLSALLHGLQETGQLAAVTEAAQDRLGGDHGDPELRSEALRAIIRVGLNEIEPDLMDTAVDARRAYRESQEESF